MIPAGLVREGPDAAFKSPRTFDLRVGNDGWFPSVSIVS